jgi:hypothetical protein
VTPLAALGGDDDEALNLELVYVYIEDERPPPHRAPTEPAARSVLRKRAPPGDVPPCSP